MASITKTIILQQLLNNESIIVNDPKLEYSEGINNIERGAIK